MSADATNQLALNIKKEIEKHKSEFEKLKGTNINYSLGF